MKRSDSIVRAHKRGAACWVGALGIWLGLSGCNSATELVVIVDSDLVPETEITAVEVQVTADALGAETRRFEVAETGLPLSFSVAPANDSVEIVRLMGRAVGPEGNNLISRTAVLSFVPGRSVRVDFPLARACAFGEELCTGSEETCSDGDCVGIEIDSSALPDAPSGDPPRLFEGPSMAADAGPDAGPDGGECIEGAACSPPRTCLTGQMRCGAEPICETSGMMPAGTPCGEGRYCNAEGGCGR